MSNRFLDGQMSGLVENFNIGIYSDTITGDKCQTLHNGTTDWAWPIRVTFNDLDDILRSERYLRGLTKKKKKNAITRWSWNFVWLSSKSSI